MKTASRLNNCWHWCERLIFRIEDILIFANFEISSAREFNRYFSRPIFRVGEILEIEVIHVGSETFEIHLFICVEFEAINGRFSKQ